MSTVVKAKVRENENFLGLTGNLAFLAEKQGQVRGILKHKLMNCKTYQE